MLRNGIGNVSISRPFIYLPTRVSIYISMGSIKN
mgnify:CR=1 FL=1